jgi:hypothetical protein
MRAIDEVMELLKTSGAPWEIRQGKRHKKIIVNGRLVGILPNAGGSHSYGGSRAHKNMLSQVRRAIKG